MARQTPCSKCLIPLSAASKNTIRPSRRIWMPGIQLSRDPKRSKAGGSLHTFGYLVFPLGGSLGPWPWKLTFGKDACREGGQLWAKVKKIHHHLRTQGPHAATPEMLTFNPTMNSHTVKSQQLTRLVKAAILISRPEVSHS